MIPVRKPVIIAFLLLLSGCFSNRVITDKYIRENIDPMLPSGWIIKSIEKNKYPPGYEKDGPSGYKVVLEGKKRMSRVVWEESRREWKSGLRYIKPSYDIWVMPVRFQGERIECDLQTSYYCKSAFAWYIGSNNRVSIFTRCKNCYYIKSNFRFREKELVKKLTGMFKLNRNIFDNAY
jgi:hypothetical protein